MSKSYSSCSNSSFNLKLACQNVGLFLNAKKTKFIHIDRTNDDKLYSSDGSEIERVEDFLYLGSYTETDHDMNVRIAQAWNALHSLRKVWKSNISKSTKTKVFKACVESILLYGSESWTLNISRTKRLDGTYTRMLRSAFDISWKNHPTIPEIYGKLPHISNVVRRRRLALAGHVSRHNEPAGKLKKIDVLVDRTSPCDKSLKITLDLVAKTSLQPCPIVKNGEETMYTSPNGCIKYKYKYNTLFSSGPTIDEENLKPI